MQCSRILLLVRAFACWSTFVLGAAGTGGCATKMFLPDTPSEEVQAAAARSALSGAPYQRERIARFDASIFASAALGQRLPRLLVNLFSDTEFTTRSREAVDGGNGVAVWQAHDEDSGVERFSLAGKDGVFVADIRRGGRVFRIEPLDSGVSAGWYRIGELDSAQFPQEAMPLPEPPEVQAEPAPPTVLRVCDDLPTPKPVRVRILIVYTAASPSITIAQDIALLIDQLNQVWSTSPYFYVIAELAGSHLTNYQSSTTAMNQDLRRLTNGSDGFMDEVHPIRDQTKADLVALLVETSPNDTAGIAWLATLPHRPASQAYGFSVVNRHYGITNLTFAHEIGHNFGMDHDRPYAQSPATGYNFGYVNHAIRARDTLAYNNQCTAKGYTCSRYPVYSNPRPYLKTEALGRDIGTRDAAYNLEVLCRGAGVVSGYRNSAP